MKYPRYFLCLALAGFASVHAADVRVAVAANFAAPLKALAPDFEKRTGHQLLLSVGATGKLFAQIKGGAPFDVFLSADTPAPARLVQAGLASAQFTYATGRLILWSVDAQRVDAQGSVLKTDTFRHLAIAAPKLAPYGAAAQQTLTHLGLWNGLAPRLVQGESIGQTYSFVATGNAELGFVALSQVWGNKQLRQGSGWLVPAHMHAPLHQDAVLLNAGKANPGAIALLDFLKTEASKSVIRSFGYEAP